MTLQTQIESYAKLLASGDISERLASALKIITENPGITARGVHKILEANGNKVSSKNVFARVNELWKVGLIEEAGVVYDEETNRNVTAWRATGNEPYWAGLDEFNKKGRMNKHIVLMIESLKYGVADDDFCSAWIKEAEEILAI